MSEKTDDAWVDDPPTWRQLAVEFPVFVQWVVQVHGPRRTEHVDRHEFEALMVEFRETLR